MTPTSKATAHKYAHKSAEKARNGVNACHRQLSPSSHCVPTISRSQKQNGKKKEERLSQHLSGLSFLSSFFFLGGEHQGEVATMASVSTWFHQNRRLRTLSSLSPSYIPPTPSEPATTEWIICRRCWADVPTPPTLDAYTHTTAISKEPRPPNREKKRECSTFNGDNNSRSTIRPKTRAKKKKT
jgi:hypothetical protein